MFGTPKTINLAVMEFLKLELHRLIVDDNRPMDCRDNLPDIILTSWMGFDSSTDEHYLQENSSKGVGMVMKSELEHILPYKIDKLPVEDVEKEGTDTNNGQEILTKLIKDLKRPKKLFVKERILLDGAEVIDFFKNSVQ